LTLKRISSLAKEIRPAFARAFRSMASGLRILTFIANVRLQAAPIHRDALRFDKASHGEMTKN
jgi:hypothetical protein